MLPGAGVVKTAAHTAAPVVVPATTHPKTAAANDEILPEAPGSATDPDRYEPDSSGLIQELRAAALQRATSGPRALVSTTIRAPEKTRDRFDELCAILETKQRPLFELMVDELYERVTGAKGS